MAPTFLDVESALREWGNTRTSLVGDGNPLRLGFHDARPRSPGRGVFATVEATDGGDGPTAEGGICWARVTTHVWSVTDRQAARRAALAWMNTLASLSAAPSVNAGVRLLMASEVDGPQWNPAEDEPRYTVTAVVHATAPI